MVGATRSRPAEAGSHSSAPPVTPFTICEDLHRDSSDTVVLRDLLVTNSGEPPRVVDGLLPRDARVFIPLSSVALATLL